MNAVTDSRTPHTGAAGWHRVFSRFLFALSISVLAMMSLGISAEAQTVYPSATERPDLYDDDGRFALDDGQRCSRPGMLEPENFILQAVKAPECSADWVKRAMSPGPKEEIARIVSEKNGESIGRDPYTGKICSQGADAITAAENYTGGYGTYLNGQIREAVGASPTPTAPKGLAPCSPPPECSITGDNGLHTDVKDKNGICTVHIQQLSNGLAFYALLMCVTGLLISAILWAIGSKGQNPGQELTGKKGIIVCCTAAFFIGALPPMMQFLNNAASDVQAEGGAPAAAVPVNNPSYETGGPNGAPAVEAPAVPESDNAKYIVGGPAAGSRPDDGGGSGFGGDAPTAEEALNPGVATDMYNPDGTP